MANPAASACHVAARFYPPPPDLTGCLTSIYRLDLDVPDGGTLVDWLQPEWTNLRVFSGALPMTKVGDGPEVTNARFTVSGPSSHSARFEPGTTRMWGVGLLPLGCRTRSCPLSWNSGQGPGAPPRRRSIVRRRRVSDRNHVTIPVRAITAFRQ